MAAAESGVVHNGVVSEKTDCGPMVTRREALTDGGPMERFERLMERDEREVMNEVCSRVVEGDSLAVVARDWGLPRHRFVLWVSGDDERRAAYEGALRMRADELVHESLGDATPDKMADHKLKVAGLWDRNRFGRGDGSGSGMRVVVMRFGEGSGSAQSATTASEVTFDMEK